MNPYGIISDSHNHNWSAFATTRVDGVNSRLSVILSETVRAGREVLAAGGDTLYHAGDLFHVRGNLAPSVLNPTLDVYRGILASGVKVVILAGNHDLEGKEAERIGSAITALEGIGCTVVNQAKVHYRGAGSDMLMVPWTPSIADLKAELEKWAADLALDKHKIDVLLHAPIDGVIRGLPDHGLDAPYLAALGFRRVFSGHYHHHKELEPGKVWSIGATTHQTWGDVGTKAGFLIVTDAGVKWHSARAPAFVTIDGSTDPDEIPLIVDGNYAKVTINSAKTGDVDAMRQYLMDSGALGVVVLSDKAPTNAATARAGSVYKAGTTLEQSIGDFIKAKPEFTRGTELAQLCGDILSRVRSVA